MCINPWNIHSRRYANSLVLFIPRNATNHMSLIIVMNMQIKKINLTRAGRRDAAQRIWYSTLHMTNEKERERERQKGSLYRERRAGKKGALAIACYLKISKQRFDAPVNTFDVNLPAAPYENPESPACGDACGHHLCQQCRKSLIFHAFYPWHSPSLAIYGQHLFLSPRRLSNLKLNNHNTICVNLNNYKIKSISEYI